MADEHETKIENHKKRESYEILVEVHGIVNKVKLFNTRLDERLKVVEKFRSTLIKWVLGIAAGVVITTIAALIIALAKGAF